MKSKKTPNSSSRIFNVCGQNPIYERVRDPGAWLKTRSGGSLDQRKQKLEEYLGLQERMENAWCTFEISAEKNFLHGLRDTFWASWFELYLQHVLMELGLNNVATTRQGEPDFIVHQENRHLFDLEATILTAGSGANSAPRFPLPDFGSPIVQNVSDNVWSVNPDGELKQSRNPLAQTDYCLRITGALDAKLNQIRRWKETGSCDPSIVPVAVAISSAKIDYDTNGIISHSQFERVLYGKGDLQPIQNAQAHTVQYGRKQSMTNKNEAKIILGLFDRPEYQELSAVAYFPDGLLDYGEHPPEIYLNPNALAAFPTNILKVGVYKTFAGNHIEVVKDYRSH